MASATGESKFAAKRNTAVPAKQKNPTRIIAVRD